MFNVYNSLLQEHTDKQLDNRSWEDSSIPGKKDVWMKFTTHRHVCVSGKVYRSFLFSKFDSFKVNLLFSGHLFPVVLFHFPESARVNRCKRTFRCPQLIRSSVQKTASVPSTVVLVSKAF